MDAVMEINDETGCFFRARVTIWLKQNKLVSISNLRHNNWTPDPSHINRDSPIAQGIKIGFRYRKNIACRKPVLLHSKLDISSFNDCL